MIQSGRVALEHRILLTIRIRNVVALTSGAHADARANLFPKRQIIMPRDDRARAHAIIIHHRPHRALQIGRPLLAYGPKRCRYSVELMNALTISAFWKFPLN